MRFLSVYQYVAPVILLVLGYSLWLQRFSGDHRLVLLVMSVPILFAYVIPVFGANMLGLWEINTRLRMGKIRPHHGFVFGSAAALLTYVCTDTSRGDFGPLTLFRSAFVVGSVIGFWNWLYDSYAIRSGFIKVYTRPWADGEGPEAIATSHAPVLFGTFGACYGLAIAIAVHVLVTRGLWEHYWTLLVATNAAGVVLPLLAYMGFSYLRYGENGLRSYAERPPKEIGARKDRAERREPVELREPEALSQPPRARS